MTSLNQDFSFSDVGVSEENPWVRGWQQIWQSSRTRVALTEKRRKTEIRRPNKYSAICSLEDQPDSKLLFGNDLAKTLRDAKDTSNISSLMKWYPTKPYNNKNPLVVGMFQTGQLGAFQRDLGGTKLQNPRARAENISQGRICG